jgi:hypothetical protein
VWWHIPVIPAFGNWRQEDGEFKASLSYIATTVFNKRRKAFWFLNVGY